MGRVLVVLLALAAPAAAQSQHPAPVEGDYVVRDYVFASGERLPQLRLHYGLLPLPRRRGATGTHPQPAIWGSRFEAFLRELPVR